MIVYVKVKQLKKTRLKKSQINLLNRRWKIKTYI